MVLCCKLTQILFWLCFMTNKNLDDGVSRKLHCLIIQVGGSIYQIPSLVYY